MATPPVPRGADEQHRLEALQRYHLLDPSPDSALDDLAALAARLCETPAGLIVIAAPGRLAIRAAVGWPDREMPRDPIAGAHLAAGRDPVIVEDTAADPRFAGTPLTAGDPPVRFYAGIPIVVEGDTVLGALAVIDHRPRRLLPAQLDALRGLARQAGAHLEVRRREHELSRSEGRLFQAFQNSPVPMLLYRPGSRRIVELNEEFSRLTRWSRHEAMDRTVTDLGFLDEDTEHRLDERLQAGQRLRDEEVVVHTRDGQVRHALVSAELLSFGDDTASLTTFIDVTARRGVEAALTEKERRLRLAVEAAHLGTFDWDVAENRITWSGRHAELWGYGPGEFDGTYDGFASRVHPDDRSGISDAVARSFAERRPYHHEFRVVWPDGSVHWVLGRGEATYGADGRPLRMYGAVVETTVRRLYEARIRKLNRVYAVLSGINQTILRETDARALLAAACRIAVEHGEFGMAWIGLLSGSGALEIVAHAGADDPTLAIVSGLLADPPRGCVFTAAAIGTGQHGICNDIARDPQAAAWREAALARGYAAMASLPLTVDGRVVGNFNLYAGEPDTFDEEEMRLLDELAADISFAIEVHERESRRLEAERALRESQERFRELADHIQEVFWVTDPQRMRVLYASPAFETIWGRSRASIYEAAGGWLETVHPDDRARVRERASRKTSAGAEVYRIVRPDGAVRWIHERSAPVRAENGEILRVVGTAEDVTAERELEEQFRQSQKMEAIGQLAGGVAHDFNNILAAIMMQADLAGSNEGTPADTLELLEDIKASAERAANLTRQLLAFSRRQVMQPTVLDLNEVVTDLTRMLQRLVGEHVPVRLRLTARPLRTHADAVMVDQLLLNLVVNARDAMPGGGELFIETYASDVSAEQAAAFPDAVAGPHVWLRVRDTGVGIPPEDLPRIFEPFFTTKDQGKGTGLGLATVFGVVRQHGGIIAAASTPGEGTTFDVGFRAHDAPSAAAAPARPVPGRHAGTTVLLVEDEGQVRVLVRFALERYGFVVLEAPHGAEALQVWEAHRDAVALVVTDLVMPGGVHARDFVARLRNDRPGLPMVFTSGYSADIAGRELGLREGQNFLRKPFSPAQLAEIVVRALER